MDRRNGLPYPIPSSVHKRLGRKARLLDEDEGAGGRGMKERAQGEGRYGEAPKSDWEKPP